MPNVSGQPQKPPTLTELAERQHTLSERLISCTRLRNYLFNVLKGEQTEPLLKVVPTAADEPQVTVSMGELPTNVADIILTALMEHAEKLALDTWSALQDVVQAACNLTRQIATEKSTPVDDVEEQQATVPFPVPRQSAQQVQSTGLGTSVRRSDLPE